MSGTLRLGSAPINWGIESPEAPENPSPEAVIEAIASAGYEGSELGPLYYFGRSSSEIADRFAEQGLDAIAFWLGVPLAERLAGMQIGLITEAVTLLRDLHVDQILISDFGHPRRMEIVSRVESFPECWWTEEDWRQVRDSLVQIAELSDSFGIRTAVHPHVGGHIESGREIEMLLEIIDSEPINLCIDTGHIRIGGVDAIPLLESQANQVTHIHAKDVDPDILEQMRDGEIDYITAVGAGLYCDLGTGMVDWLGFKQALDRTNYIGWIVAEQDRIQVPGSVAAFESNRNNAAFLLELLKIAGD